MASKKLINSNIDGLNLNRDSIFSKEPPCVELNLEASKIQIDKWGVHYFENEGTLWFRQSDILPLNQNGAAPQYVRGMAGYVKQIPGPVLLQLVSVQPVANNWVWNKIKSSTRLYVDNNVYVSHYTVQQILNGILTSISRCRCWGMEECAFVKYWFDRDAMVPEEKQLYYSQKRVQLNNKRIQKLNVEIQKVKQFKKDLTQFEVVGALFNKHMKEFDKAVNTDYPLIKAVAKSMTAALRNND